MIFDIKQAKQIIFNCYKQRRPLILRKVWKLEEICEASQRV